MLRQRICLWPSLILVPMLAYIHCLRGFFVEFKERVGSGEIVRSNCVSWSATFWDAGRDVFHWVLHDGSILRILVFQVLQHHEEES